MNLFMIIINIKKHKNKKQNQRRQTFKNNNIEEVTS